MQQDAEKTKKYFHNFECPRHSNFLITFVCISHQSCDRDNMLCIECIDELNGTMNHHLVSVKKFTRYLQVYQRLSAQISQRNNTRETVQVLRKELDKKLNGIQFLLTGNISFLKKCSSRLKAQNNNNHQPVIQNQKQGQSIKLSNFISTDNPNLSNQQQQVQVFQQYEPFFGQDRQCDRTQIRSIAKRKIWTKINKKNIDGESIKNMLQLEIDNVQVYTLSILEKILHFSKQSLNNGLSNEKIRKIPEGQLNQHQKQAELSQFIVIPEVPLAEEQEPMVSFGQIEAKPTLKKGFNCQNQDKIKQNISDQQPSQISSSCSVITVKVIKKQKKKYSSKYKRYTITEKNKILKDIKLGLDRKVISKKHKISTSTIARWQRAINQANSTPAINQNSKTVQLQKKMQSKVEIDLL